MHNKINGHILTVIVCRQVSRIVWYDDILSFVFIRSTCNSFLADTRGFVVRFRHNNVEGASPAWCYSLVLRYWCNIILFAKILANCYIRQSATPEYKL